jgi:hypothetical protein
MRLMQPFQKIAPNTNRPGRDKRGRILGGDSFDLLEGKANTRRFPRRGYKRKKRRSIKCRHCRRIFLTTSPIAKYCSRTCYKKHIKPRRQPRPITLNERERALLPIFKRPWKKTADWWMRQPGEGLLIPLSEPLARELHRVMPLLTRRLYDEGHAIEGMDEVSEAERLLHDLLLAQILATPRPKKGKRHEQDPETEA